ncbi:MAG: MMPL family transporter [Deltaproteobacteria bacterium]|nr:MMPL family transporter [Deltaproteobacteria bacterium]
MQRLYAVINSLTNRYKILTIIVFVLLSVASLFLAQQNLKFDTNQDNLMDKEQSYFQDYLSFLKEFGDWESIYIVVVPKNTATETHLDDFRKQAGLFADQLAEKLVFKKQLFPEIIYRNPKNASLVSNALLYLSDEDFQKFESTFKKQSAVFSEFLRIDTLADFYRWNRHLLENANSNTESLFDDHPRWGEYWHDSLLSPFQKDAQQRFYKTSLLTLISGQYQDFGGHLFGPKGDILFVQVLPRKDFNQTEIIARPLAVLRSTIEDLQKNYPALQIGITGRPVLQNDEATSTEQDSETAGLVAFLAVAALITFCFKRKALPIAALFSLAAGIAITLGVLTLLYGTINLLSLVFGVILIGLGIDYGVHVLSAYDFAPEQQWEKFKSTLPPIFLGCVTSAIAFATALFTNFEGLKQLGVISALGLIICCVAQFLLTPSIIGLFKQKQQGALSTQALDFFGARIRNLSQNKGVLFFGILLFGISLPALYKIRFDANILNMQSPDLESVRYEKIIQEKTNESTWFLATSFSDLNELKVARQKIQNLKTVKSTLSVLDFIPQQNQKRQEAISELVRHLKTKVDTPAAQDLSEEVKLFIQSIEQKANQALMAGKEQDFESLHDLQTQLEQGVKAGALQEQAPFLARLKDHQNLFTLLFHPEPLTPSTLPKALSKRLIGSQGQYALTIWPNKNIWDETHQKEFIEEVRSILPSVTGAPITTYESTKDLVQGFFLVASLAAFIVIVLLLFHFRSLRLSSLIFLNLIESLIVLNAIMMLLDQSINLANFFAIPVLIGTGIDHGIHIASTQSKTKQEQDRTFFAITLSSFTTAIGFGALSFVQHPGLASFGFIMAIGSLLIWAYSTLVLPGAIKRFSD